MKVPEALKPMLSTIQVFFGHAPGCSSCVRPRIGSDSELPGLDRRNVGLENPVRGGLNIESE